MPAIESVPQTVLVSLAVYLSWRLLRPFVVKTSLDNLPGPPSPSFVEGIIPQLLGPQPWEYRDKLIEQYGRLFTLPAIFGSKWVHVYDTKAFHAIFIKEQDNYEEDGFMLRIMLGPGLLGTLGDQHRRQRKMLTPVFSTKHLRDMSPVFFNVIHKTRDALVERIREASETTTPAAEFDMLSWMGRTTLEVLGQAGLGYSFDALTEDRPDDFAEAVKDLFPQVAKGISLFILSRHLRWFGTKALHRRIVELYPTANVQRLKDIADILHERSVLIFNEKKAALQAGDDALKHQIGEGRDVMSVLLRQNMMASEEDRLPDDELIAQVSTMILAGMDTTANSLARVLQLLSENPDVQEKLRAEIIQAAESDAVDGVLEYDKLMGLPYLEAVCRETLRISPGVTMLFREVQHDTILPMSEPIHLRDGTLSAAVPIPKGTTVVTNIKKFNTDPALWGPDAEEWKPERWLEPLPREVEEARVPGVYSHLMTFIGGNKSCIGFKFAQVELKAVLFVLLQEFKFEPSEKPIAWNYASVQFPSIVGKNGPEMPLKVSLLRS